MRLIRAIAVFVIGLDVFFRLVLAFTSFGEELDFDIEATSMLLLTSFWIVTTLSNIVSLIRL